MSQFSVKNKFQIQIMINGWKHTELKWLKRKTQQLRQVYEY